MNPISSRTSEDGFASRWFGPRRNEQHTNLADASFNAPVRRVKSFGEQIREWRRQRNLTQMELAADADVSTKHLSFLETGRSQPSRAMLLRLADRLALPRPDRDWLLIAAGYAPMYSTCSPPAPAVRSVDATRLESCKP